MFYAKSTNGFYMTEIHGANIPGDAVEITDAEYTALLAAQSQGKVISADAGGNPVAVDPSSLLTFDQIKAIKFAEIDALRDQKINAGIPYTFPDGAGTIQTRDEKDIRNIQARTTAGIVLSGQAISLDFRDEEDVTHLLTPEQMVTMGLYVSNYGSEIYRAAWAHKGAITALTTAAEIEAYDITTGWPV